MAGSAFFALIDDIATVLDDVSLMTKLAAKKTAGVLGDDLALNAQQVTGVRAERELPVVWAVAKGSLKNKAILVPAALAISAFIPWAVTPLLMLGGAFLCFEGFEKLAHKYLPHGEEHHEVAATAPEDVDPVAYERDKIKDAVRTDFILSAEIIAITLGTVAGAPLQQQIAVLVGIALIMTAGVYGIVAGIVKLDDGGLYLLRTAGADAFGRFKAALGRVILAAAPKMMRSLSVIGTVAMFMVGGGILTHGLPFAHHAIEAAAASLEAVPVVGGVLAAIAPAVLNALFGVVAGAVVLAAVTVVQRIAGVFKKQPR
ncbi:MAG: Inner membrane protein YedI [Herbaspirillum frisingense]|uniref:Inner membrane protein YedI n=1 Tax=Herbaspirillum frisingense TaxID=92645 RepID=A0A7V8FZA2_9BURK|nr:MAG: Inner membrane protein YedI [Herbaspirillum frisingense]